MASSTLTMSSAGGSARVSAATREFQGDRVWLDVAVIVGVTLLALALGAATLRRRTA